MPSIADQTDRELGGALSVLVRQRRDHERLDELLRRLAEADDREQRAVLLAIDRLVFPHAFAEESVLWPLMRRRLPDGGALTLEVELEHQEVNELVTELEGLSAGHAHRRVLLERLTEVLRADVRDEEDVLFPRLQDVLSRRRLQLAGLAWEAARRIAPTRGHPVVARRPPGNVLAALPLSAIDRLRDRIDTRRFSGANDGRPARAASAALTRLAHRVERLPLLRRGEDPATRVEPLPASRRGRPAGLLAPAVLVAVLLVAARRRSRSVAGRGAAIQ